MKMIYDAKNSIYRPDLTNLQMQAIEAVNELCNDLERTRTINPEDDNAAFRLKACIDAAILRLNGLEIILGAWESPEAVIQGLTRQLPELQRTKRCLNNPEHLFVPHRIDQHYCKPACHRAFNNKIIRERRLATLENHRSKK